MTPSTNGGTTATVQHAEFTITSQRITWQCAACHGPIRKGTGYLEVDIRAALDRLREMEQIKKDCTTGNGSVQWDIGRVLTMPPPIPWLAHHRACDPRPGESGYWIAVERIDTLRKLIHWAGHVAGKRWIGNTDWAALLDRFGTAA